MRLAYLRSRIALTTALSTSALSLFTSPASAIYIRDDRPVAQYNAIALLPQYAAAASLRFYSTVDSAGLYTLSNCGGTLISPTKILTAAHCFVSKTGAVSSYNSLVVSFDTNLTSGPSTPTNVASVQYMPQYAASGGDATNDVAIVTLKDPVTNITPAILYAGNAQGATSTSVGYGSQGTGTSNGSPPGANNRLGAYNIIDVATANLIQFDFDSPAGTTSSFGSATPLDIEGSVAGGDSGSALFAKIGNNEFVVGDLNAGRNAIMPANPNFYGEINFYAPVANAANAQFIVQNAPDAVFERLSGGTSPNLVAVSDTEILSNITKFGSVLTFDEDGAYDFQTLDVAALATSVPEPASVLLLSLGASIATLRRRRHHNRQTAEQVMRVA